MLKTEGGRYPTCLEQTQSFSSAGIFGQSMVYGVENYDYYQIRMIIGKFSTGALRTGAPSMGKEKFEHGKEI